MKIALLAGARPNYMKVFPIWQEIRENHPNLHPVLIHTGQHYDAVMSDVFFREFDMPQPDYFLGVGSAPHGIQTGRVMMALEELFNKDRPDLLVVVGDVNSTMAGALVAVKMGIPVAHVEAGLRSYDRGMPEEINRIVTDAVSDLLLTSCREADENLRREGIPEDKIVFVGNVMIDSLVRLLPKAEASGILSRWKLEPRSYAAVTLHRPSNVDDPVQLKTMMDGLIRVAAHAPVVFPVHPRTRKMLERFGIPREAPNLHVTEPLGYLDFLCLEAKAGVVITDSGGVQEETSFLGVPCLTVRPNTERPITIREGTNRLLRLDETPLDQAALSALSGVGATPARPIECWDGKTAPRIVKALQLQRNRPKGAHNDG